MKKEEQRPMTMVICARSGEPVPANWAPKAKDFRCTKCGALSHRVAALRVKEEDSTPSRKKGFKKGKKDKGKKKAPKGEK